MKNTIENKLSDLYNSITGNCYLGTKVEKSLICSIGTDTVIDLMEKHLESLSEFETRYENIEEILNFVIELVDEILIE